MAIVLAVERRKKRTQASGSEALGIGALVAGALGLAALAMRPAGNTRVLVGGVDISNVNVMLPFFVDFSTGGVAAPEQKRWAMNRLDSALAEFRTSFPHAQVERDVDVRSGRFRILVYPLQHRAQAIARTFLS